MNIPFVIQKANENKRLLRLCLCGMAILIIGLRPYIIQKTVNYSFKFNGKVLIPIRALSFQTFPCPIHLERLILSPILYSFLWNHSMLYKFINKDKKRKPFPLTLTRQSHLLLRTLHNTTNSSVLPSSPFIIIMISV